MARQLRIEYEGAFYHVTSRGNEREWIFWDNKDREEFKRLLKRTKERYGYLLHAYALYVELNITLSSSDSYPGCKSVQGHPMVGAHLFYMF
ncbi:MAG: hypothetical protein V1753_00940 [Pseudomonadota bacterium]